MTIALVFGWRIGGIAGGVGSALADALGGYFIWAPWTLIIKGIEGILVGTIAFWGIGGARDGGRDAEDTVRGHPVAIPPDCGLRRGIGGRRLDGYPGTTWPDRSCSEASPR